MDNKLFNMIVRYIDEPILANRLFNLVSDVSYSGIKIKHEYGTIRILLWSGESYCIYLNDSFLRSGKLNREEHSKYIECVNKFTSSARLHLYAQLKFDVGETNEKYQKGEET